MACAIQLFRSHDRNVACLVGSHGCLEVPGAYSPHFRPMCSACLGNDIAVQGKLRVTRLADHWTRTDALSATTYGDAAVWRANAPGLFRDAIVRANSVL